MDAKGNRPQSSADWMLGVIVGILWYPMNGNPTMVPYNLLNKKPRSIGRGFLEIEQSGAQSPSVREGSSDLILSRST